MTTHERLGNLRLCRILSIAANGRPVLEGTNARILCAGRAQASDIGRMAVCQDIAEADESLTVVLGVLDDERKPQDDGAVIIRNGQASLALHPDGRIRMTGRDIAMDAEQGFAVLAGRIDLN